MSQGVLQILHGLNTLQSEWNRKKEVYELGSWEGRYDSEDANVSHTQIWMNRFKQNGNNESTVAVIQRVQKINTRIHTHTPRSQTHTNTSPNQITRNLRCGDKAYGAHLHVSVSYSYRSNSSEWFSYTFATVYFNWMQLNWFSLEHRP